MIPKIIHFCWFGKNKKPKIVKKCLKTWKKYCPDYCFIEWNEDNFDTSSVLYTKEAYENKKWAFVSDYVRHYALFHYGGIYIDTDVEIIKPIDDLLKSKFMGIQSINCRINSGIMMASEKGDWFCKEILDGYQNDHFVCEDGTLNLKTVCIRATEIMQKHGFVLKDTKQNIADYIIYPSSYFDPGSYFFEKGDLSNAYSIHHGSGSWLPRKERIKICIRKMMGKKFKWLRNMYKKIRGGPNEK